MGLLVHTLGGVHRVFLMGKGGGGPKITSKNHRTHTYLSPHTHASPTSFSLSSHSLRPFSPSATSSETSFSKVPVASENDQ